MLIVPACQDSVGIGQSRLCGLHDGPGAGFPDHIHGEAVGFHPFVHELYFGADRTVIVDAEGLQNGVVILVILSTYIFCGFYGRDSFAVPCKTDGLDISDAGVIITHTVLDKVFDEINTHMQFIVEVSERVDICPREVSAEVLSGYEEEIHEVLRIFQLCDPRRGQLLSLRNCALGDSPAESGCLVGRGVRLPLACNISVCSYACRTGAACFRSDRYKSDSGYLPARVGLKLQKSGFLPVAQCPCNVLLRAGQCIRNIGQCRSLTGCGKPQETQIYLDEFTVRMRHVRIQKFGRYRCHVVCVAAQLQITHVLPRKMDFWFYEYNTWEKICIHKIIHIAGCFMHIPAMWIL